MTEISSLIANWRETEQENIQVVNSSKDNNKQQTTQKAENKSNNKTKNEDVVGKLMASVQNISFDPQNP